MFWRLGHFPKGALVADILSLIVDGNLTVQTDVCFEFKAITLKQWFFRAIIGLYIRLSHAVAMSGGATGSCALAVDAFAADPQPDVLIGFSVPALSIPTSPTFPSPQSVSIFPYLNATIVFGGGPYGSDFLSRYDQIFLHANRRLQSIINKHKWELTVVSSQLQQAMENQWMLVIRSCSRHDILISLETAYVWIGCISLRRKNGASADAPYMIWVGARMNWSYFWLIT